MQSNQEDSSLDDLFAAARRAQKEERRREFAEQAKRPRKAADPEPPVEPAGLFANPENWREGRGLALIHQETRTLLGNFREWTHRSVKDARRLVRSQEPIAVEGVEEVDFGLTANFTPPVAAHKTETVRQLVVNVALETPRVSAREVLLAVHYYDGWTAKAILVEPVSFAEGGEILQLPAGVDLLPQMTRETKQELRSEL